MIILKTFQDILRHFSGNFGAIFGVILGTFWVILGQFWGSSMTLGGGLFVATLDNFGVISGMIRSFWGHFGDILGSFWGHFWHFLRSIWSHVGRFRIV